MRELFLFLFFSIRIFVFPSDSPAEEHHTRLQVLSAGRFHNCRAGLNTSGEAFEKEKNGRVAFLGGSITFNPGWRDSVCSYLTRRFPETTFELINAGIPSLGSLPDAFRAYNDVFSKGRIDLLFVEAAVNDRTNAYPASEQVRAMEGIVRQAKRANPKTDIVFMYFVDPDKINDYNKGVVPAEIINHEKVAEYYSIPSVNLAKEVTDRINNNEFTWEKDFIDLHPSPFGQQVYYRSISDLLENCWNKTLSPGMGREILPSALDAYNYDKGRLVEVTGKDETDGWIYDEKWTPSDKAGTREGYVNVPMLTGSTPGSILKFRFRGRTAGIAVAAGPDAGIIEYRIDNGEWGSVDLFTQWSRGLHLPWFLVLGDDLGNGSHTLSIRMSNLRNSGSTGTVCRIRYFLVNR